METGTNFSDSFSTVYEDDLSFLEKTVNDFPASTLSLFLLLQQYKQLKNEHFTGLLKKSAVYFPNHTWLNYQLSADISMNPPLAKGFPEESDPGSEENTEINEEELLEAVFAESTMHSSESTLEKEAVREMEHEEKVEFVQGEKAENFEESFVENAAETNPEEINENPGAAESELNIPQSEKEEEIKKIGYDSPILIESEEKAVSNTFQEDNENAELHQDRKVEGESPASYIPTSVETANQLSTVENTSGTNPSTTSSSAGAEGNDSVATQESAIEFEPLHTIDYFASQGIIIKEEALMNDKLGKQVKSFTDWLKSMKKLHPGKLPEQNQVVEKIIQSSAELSNEDAGILTEAMAEVLIKQGKREKAIEMFEKLSLMNPAKSTYFAAKIESLKK